MIPHWFQYGCVPADRPFFADISATNVAPVAPTVQGRANRMMRGMIGNAVFERQHQDVRPMMKVR
jgi:hypothetical protein